MKTALVEKAQLGGVCLNWGCIPTKTLLRSADVLRLVRDAARFGVKTLSPTVDLPAMVARSRAVAAQLNQGITYLLKKHQVAVIAGHARLQGSGRVTVTDESASVMLDRWLLTFDYGKTALSPKVTRINREDYVLSPVQLVKELRTGDLGGDLDNQELSTIAQAALERIAQRVNRPQTALAAQER